MGVRVGVNAGVAEVRGRGRSTSKNRGKDGRRRR